MGWNSAGYGVFDPIAQAFIDEDIPAATKLTILGDLIARLQSEDWDTEYDSLHKFKDDPIIVEAFRVNGVEL